MPVVVPRDMADSIEQDTLRKMELREVARRTPPPDVVTWGEKHFYIPSTGKPITFRSHQKAVLLLAFTKNERGRFPYSTVVFSTVKKSGKTTIAAVVGRWFAEEQTRFGEVFTMGNDMRQSKDRSFEMIKQSIQLTPGYRHKGSEGVLAERWSCQSYRLDCLPSGTKVEAVSVDAAGEAGSNQDLTIWCVDEQTETLTRKGFKLVHELTIADEVATLNSSTGCLEWQRPRTVNVKRYKGKMLCFHHRAASFVVTPNHRVWGKFSDKGTDEPSEWRFEEASRAARYSFGWLKGDADWDGETDFDEREARFLGYFLAEGFTSGGCYTYLCQSRGVHPETYQRMLEAVEALGYRPSGGYAQIGYVCEGDKIRIYDPARCKQFDAFGKSRDKYIPEDLKNARQEILRSFFEAYMEGDGHTEPNGGTRSANTISCRLADDLMEVGLKLGYHPRLGVYDCERYVSKQYGETQSYSVTFRTRAIGYTKPPYHHWEEIDYEGLVSCPSVPNGIFYIRRDGKCCWTGNTELWGFEDSAAIKFFHEMTPVPTKDSVRLIETYAGFDGESDLLRGIYDAGMEYGRQMTAGEVAERTGIPLGAFEESPNPDDLVPIWVNEQLGMFMYWDSGLNARRMSWQRGEEGERYYRERESVTPPPEFRRHHFNEWVGGVGEFIPMTSWDACYDPELGPLEEGDKTPAVLSVDGAVTGDCFGVVLLTRNPKHPDMPAIRHARKWDPPKGGRIDFDEPEAWIRECVKAYNVIEVCYDKYQLEQMMRQLYKEGINTQAFDQGGARLVADSNFYKTILGNNLAHRGNPELREHVQNSAGRIISDKEDSKLRIVKRVEYRKIDLCVAASMGCDRITYYNL